METWARGEIERGAVDQGAYILTNLHLLRRQFVKEVLPRLAYANPSIRMDVKYYMPRANSAQAAGEGQGGAAVEEAATATEGSEAAESAEASTSASAAPSSSEAKVSSVELDFGESWQESFVVDFAR